MMKRVVIAVMMLALAAGPSAANAAAPVYQDYAAACRDYLAQHVTVQDVWAGWVSAAGPVRAVKLATGSIANGGRQAIRVQAVTISLLDARGRVLREFPVLNAPNGSVWQPQLNAGQSVGFHQLLPPTEGSAPPEWTGEIWVHVTGVELL